MLLTFFLVVIGWIIFRSTGIPSLLHYFQGMLQFGTLRASYRFFTLPEMWPANVYIIIMLMTEWLQKGKEHGLDLAGKKRWLRTLVYYGLIVLIIVSSGKSSTFIYFQF